MLAHGFTIEQLVESRPRRPHNCEADCVVTGAHEFEVTTLQITEAGRKALAATG